MSSMRKLKRRLLRWDRYAVKTGHQRPMSAGTDPRRWLRGHCRALDAVDIEQERRDHERWNLQETYPGSGVFE